MFTTNVSTQAAALADKLRSLRFAMFTTVDQHGHLTAHPMTRQEVDEEACLWFFTSTTTPLWEDIARQSEVNVSFSDPNDSLYVSISGQAERIVDRERIHALWNPMVQAWFPHGPDDEHVVLVRVRPHGAEYWDANDSKMVRMFQMAKAAVTGSPPEAEPGEHGKIEL